ncbi:hypothetical protein D9615_003339 [Tricholomella constricta]|uniref:Yeast cell wall synthesis Kre9/Knh1-like N-terminal domain-containing protein n=1 Tax=Tricholomella constricta TaxID=117010 RepID=A0A8H5HJ48_9AGAR|nr:hypothetical protein D9615_003339 [Tricholomella constricta]
MFSRSLVALALAASALANVYTTSPTASTKFSGGKEATISWQDDGKAPSMKDFGPAKVSIYVGNAQQQTLLQTIVPSVDVSTTQSIQFTPDASIGPNSNEYFIRFESLSLKDAAQPQFPALAFSSKFEMDSMTGVFSAPVLDQIKGQSTAPLAGATVAPSKAATTSAAPTKASGTPTASKSAAASQTSNAALGTKAGWFGIVAGAVVGASMF